MTGLAASAARINSILNIVNSIAQKDSGNENGGIMLRARGHAASFVWRLTEPRPQFAFSDESNLPFVLCGNPSTRHGVLCIALFSKLYLWCKHGSIAQNVKTEITARNLRRAGNIFLGEAQAIAFDIGGKTFADGSKLLHFII